MGVTAVKALPYPDPTDRVTDLPAAMAALANAVEAKFARGVPAVPYYNAGNIAATAYAAITQAFSKSFSLVSGRRYKVMVTCGYLVQSVAGDSFTFDLRQGGTLIPGGQLLSRANSTINATGPVLIGTFIAGATGATTIDCAVTRSGTGTLVIGGYQQIICEDIGL